MTWPRNAEGAEPADGTTPQGEAGFGGHREEHLDTGLRRHAQRTAPPIAPDDLDLVATPELRLALQCQACEVAARYFAGEQSGPRPGRREADYIAPLLRAAAETIRMLERAAS